MQYRLPSVIEYKERLSDLHSEDESFAYPKTAGNRLCTNGFMG